MSYKRWLAIATFIAAPLSLAAQEKSQHVDPTDPAAASTSSQYQSVFDNYQPMADESQTPDQTWRAANEEMGKIGGHAGHIKNVEQSSQPDVNKASAVKALPPQPSSPMPAGHTGHGMSH